MKLLLILFNTWIFDLFWTGSKMTVKMREIRQKEPKGERTFGADCTCAMGINVKGIQYKNNRHRHNTKNYKKYNRHFTHVVLFRWLY